MSNFSRSIESTKFFELGRRLSRAEYLTLGLVVAISNALIVAISTGIAENGFITSALNTFNVSALVWAGAAMSVHYAIQMPLEKPRKADKIAVAGVIAACLLPLGPLNWSLLSVFAGYLIISSNAASSQVRAGWIALAITVPMFWSKRLFDMFSNFFLSIDAMLVSSITQTERTANLVAMPGGSGVLQISAPCSSMANVSLAILCWVLFTQANGIRWRPRNIAWCAGACVAVVMLNVTRITMIGYFPHYYELLHGPVGATVSSWLICITVALICYAGTKNARAQSV